MSTPADSFEFDPVPAYTKPTHVYGTELQNVGEQDQFMSPIVKELLVSHTAYRQRGVTLAGGQGVLPTGAALAQRTSNGLYYLCNPAAADGTQTPLGFLRDARNTAPSGVATNCQGNLVYSGAVHLSIISGQDTQQLLPSTGGGIGSSTTGCYTLLHARIDLPNDAFIF